MGRVPRGRTVGGLSLAGAYGRGATLTGTPHDHSHGHDEFDWSASAAHLAAWDGVWASAYRDVAEWLGIGAGADVADVGSGAGGFAAALAERVGADGQVTLIDGDERLLDVARSNLPPGVDVRSVHADLEGAPLGALVTERFDIVHAGNVIHHTDDQQHTVDDLARLLRPGGRLVLAEGGLTPGSFLVSTGWANRISRPASTRRRRGGSGATSAPARRPWRCPTAGASRSAPPAWPTCAPDRSWSTSRRRSAPTSVPSSRTRWPMRWAAPASG